LELVKRFRQRRAEYLALPEHLRRETEHQDRMQRRRELGDAISADLDVLFSPSRKHVDDRESGGGPIDLESGVVELPRTSEADPE